MTTAADSRLHDDRADVSAPAPPSETPAVAPASLEGRARTLELAREIGRAARVLWAEGSVAQAYRLLSDDYRRLVAEVRRDPALLAAAPDRAARLEELERVLASVSGPELDREFSEVHAGLVDRLSRERRVCIGMLHSLGRTRFRLGHRGVVALAAAALILLGLLALRADPRSVVVSASYSDEFPPENAVDGATATEWLLPNGQTGWLEIQFGRPRSLAFVRLKNAHNRWYVDRATRDFTVDAYAAGKVVASVSGTFPPPTDSEAAWKDLPLVARDVTRLRIGVSSFYGVGGGLAEVAVR